MKRMIRTIQEQHGQTLLWVAVALVGLLIFVALAIDIGIVYTERRQMQNSADAGALAGARELCVGNSESSANNVAWEYAVNRNRRPYPQNAIVVTSDYTVTVTAFEDVDLFFGGITGIPTFTVSAKAMAACGAVKDVCGLWPIAFDRQRWNLMWNGGAGCGQEFYVWNDDKIVDCNIYDCDLNNDGRDEIVSGGDRGWLDLSGVVDAYSNDCIQPGCGAAELACLLLGNSSNRMTIPATGLCVSGDSGVKAGVANEVNARAGDTVAIPLFSSIGCSEASGNCPGGMRFLVTSIGCVTVIGWEHYVRLEPRETEAGSVALDTSKDKKTPTPTSEIPPEPTPTPTPKHVPPITGKAIRVRLNCNQDCMSACGSTGGRPGAPWEDRAVSLIE